MNKRLISESNPQGVEYPEAVTADGKLVSAIEIEKDNEVWKDVKFYFLGCEGDDEEEMLFIQRKHKNGVTKFFRHRPGYIGDRNEPDRYLHNYAELRIKQRFDECKESNYFPVQYYVVEKCPESSFCKLKANLKCNGDPKPVLKTLNLRKLYDTCTIEKGADKYIADLLLTNSQDKSILPMFLEVFVTHKCTDAKKASGYQIIEIKINKKEDTENPIIENTGDIVDEYLFMKNENQKALPPIAFYGFIRDIAFNNYVRYGNISLTKYNKELVADYKAIACNEVGKNTIENKAFNLSVALDDLKDIDIYELGMAKAQDLGLKVRDCTLCYQYKIPYMNSSRIDSRSCHLKDGILTTKDDQGRDKIMRNPYIFQLPHRCIGFDKTKMAVACMYYSIDRQRISKLVCLLEKMNHHLRVDDSLLPLIPKPIEESKTREISKPKEQDEEKPLLTNPMTYEHGRKLLTPTDCFSCPIYRPFCGHCLGAEMKDGKRFVVCDYQRPKL